MAGRIVRFLVERSALALAIGTSVILTALMFVVYCIVHKFGTDFGVYWLTANRPVSMAYELRDSYPFPYAPTMLLWVKPLALMPKWPAFFAWFVTSALLFHWACRKHLTAQETWLALISAPVTFCFMTGQVSVALAALILWAIGTDKRAAAGIALGIVASVKPQLVALAPLLLALRGDWRAFGWAGVSFAAIVGAALLAFGTQPWVDWFASLDNFRAVLIDDKIIRAVASPYGQADRWGLNPAPFLIAGAAFGAWLVYRCRGMGPLEQAAAVGAGSIFASPYALTYDLAVCVPFLAAAVFRGRVVAALAISGSVPPLPIIFTAFELVGAKFGLHSLSVMREAKAR